MFQRLDTLLFHYKLFLNLFKYGDPRDTEEQQLLDYLVKEFKQKIDSFYLGKEEVSVISEGNLDFKKDYICDLENRKLKYNYYLDLLKNNKESLEIYNIAKKIFRGNSLNCKKNISIEIKKSQFIKNFDVRNINKNSNRHLKFIDNIFIYKFVLFVIGLFIFIVIALNILLNTLNIADSISEHGTISNMVDLHSSFAITTKVLMIINFTFCLILVIVWIITYNNQKYKNIFQNLFVLNLGQLCFVLYTISLVYSLYFISTGFIWAEFTWGGRIWKFESKMIQLWIHITLNVLFCFVFFFLRKNSFFSILNLILIISIVSFIFFSFYGNIEQPYSVHQNTDSLHLFLRFVGAGTGYYVVIFVLYLFYLTLSYLVMEYECLQLIITKSVFRFYSKFIN